MDMANHGNFQEVAMGGRMKTMVERLEENSPYNIFFTGIPMSPNTLGHTNSIVFTDLLCPSLGNLKCSLQLNFLVDVAWLLGQYNQMGQGGKPLTILYGKRLNEDGTRWLNVTENIVHPGKLFGTHHSKIGIYVYEDDSLRVVVSTANLMFDDWNHYCQGLWISPLCRKLPQGLENTFGESPTNFKYTLLTYLQKYQLPELTNFIQYVGGADFSAIRVFLVSSAPGPHRPADVPNHCHLFSAGQILSSHCSLPPTEDILSWRVIAQASSFGSLRDRADYWLRGIFLSSLASHTLAPFQENSSATLNVIYPTVGNVLNSYCEANGGGCLSFSLENKTKQAWLKQYLHNWKADDLSRTRAMPHIKTYCRVSPCETKLAWFFLTSANISQAAWGSKMTKAGISNVLSFEVGVMFVPKFFDQNYFKIKDDGLGGKVFPFIYDLPLIPYGEQDEPWCTVSNF